jgi:3-dehydroquinate dehydratase-1
MEIKNMKIIVPIMPKNLAELANLDEKKYSTADLIEWRADFMPISQLEVAALQVKAKFPDKPLVFTFRTEDKSRFEISESTYANLIEKFAGIFDYIDVEKFTFPNVKLPSNTIFSYHDFKQIPENLSEILSKMVAENPQIVKFAGMPKKTADVLRLMSETLAMSEKHPNQLFVTMAMGDLGKISRLASDTFGSSWTFATVDISSAPGQLYLADVVKMREIL